MAISMFHVEHSPSKRRSQANLKQYFPETKLRPQMTQNDIKTLLKAYVSDTETVPIALYEQLEQYLRLLLKWNARTNLTAIRDPEEIVRRHFGESLFAAQHLGNCNNLLDFGSGAGFPGLPIQLFRPDLSVTLAESQNKKATFLREAVRTLGLKTEVWPARVEAMPVVRQFDVVTLRAVDNMDAAIVAASLRAAKRMILLTTACELPFVSEAFATASTIRIPGSNEQNILILIHSAA